MCGTYLANLFVFGYVYRTISSVHKTKFVINDLNSLDMIIMIGIILMIMMRLLGMIRGKGGQRKQYLLSAK